MTEAAAEFACFGATCGVRVLGDAADGTTAEAAVAAARAQLLDWHERFTRFAAGSELSHLNADPAERVAVSPDMARFAAAVVGAARRTNGLVDATLLGALEAAGYRRDLPGSVPLALALRLAPPRRPARPRPEAWWREIDVDLVAGNVTRPPGVRLDSGGLAKGLFADLLGERLRVHPSFAIDCAGDVLLGGAGGVERAVRVASPFDGGTLHTFTLVAGGVATSGIGRRSWLDADGRPAHHLLDPGTGRPAFTGIVQATAVGPTALDAEVRSKAALLSGPGEARRWLPDGGVLVLDDGRSEIIESAVAGALVAEPR